MYPETDEPYDDGGEPKPKKEYPPSPARMSKIPSWVSIGVIIGFIVGWNIRPMPKPAPVEVRLVEPAPRAEPAPTKLTTIEAVFEQWGHFAVWDENNSTQIAYWNPGTQDFTEFYAVHKMGDALFFRSIPNLTRRIVLHGKAPPPECTLRFTETEAQYQAWLESTKVRKAEPSR